MAPWFSASAVGPALASAGRLGPTGAAWLTISVQLGFVAGALVSAVLTLSDRWSARWLAAGASLAAAAATLGVSFSRGPVAGFALRVATGAALAGVYPPGMKIAAGGCGAGRGWALGTLGGALTLGSATRLLVRWLVPAEAWRLVLVVAAASAALGAGLMLLVPHDGPYTAPSPPFSWSAAPRILRDRGVLLANAGYLGHMWELYAMWTWTASFVAASETARRGPGASATAVAALVTCCVVGMVAIGCWLGGRYADRLGRTPVTSAAMAVSGACALGVGVVYGSPIWILVPVLLVWGVAVIADSAQCSAAVSELAPAAYVGTALTLQTSLGVLLTAATIYLVPRTAQVTGWRWSMSVLAIGPALGVWAMRALRRRPEASRMADRKS